MRPDGKSRHDRVCIDFFVVQLGNTSRVLAAATTTSTALGAGEVL